MRAIIRRLRQLERVSVAPEVLSEIQRAADLVRERRCRRLEAAGLPFLEHIPYAVVCGPGGYPMMAQVICECRRKRL